MRGLLAIGIIMLLVPWLRGEDLTGVVVGVIAPDQLRVGAGGITYRIQLRGVTCEEMDGDTLKAAQKFMSGTALRRKVQVRGYDPGWPGEIKPANSVTLEDGTDLAQALLMRGLARTSAAGKGTPLEEIESRARAKGTGLWAPPTPTPTPGPTPTPQPTPTPTAPAGRASDLLYPDLSEGAPGSGQRIVYITETGGKYHRAGCRRLVGNYTAIGLEEAKRQGYLPCTQCGAAW